MAPWMTPPSGVDRRSQHSSYSEMGRRASQPGPLPASPAPLHLEDPRDDPRLRVRYLMNVTDSLINGLSSFSVRTNLTTLLQASATLWTTEIQKS